MKYLGWPGAWEAAPRMPVWHDIAVVVDRLALKPEARKRVADSVETAAALAEGIVEIEEVVSSRGLRRPPWRCSCSCRAPGNYSSLLEIATASG
jgi:excinuclease UvrABC ATPase subunit